MDGRYYNLWSTDNDRTDGNDDKVIKSVYDPSPVGYSLPASNAFTGFTITGQKVGDWSEGYILTPEEKEKLNVKGDFDKGWYFYSKPNKQGNTIFFPTPGRRLHTTGTLFIDNVGTAQTAGNNNINIGAGLYFDKNIISPITDFLHSWGLPVRSAEEKIKKHHSLNIPINNFIF